LLPEVQYRVAHQIPRRWQHLAGINAALVHAHYAVDGVTALPLATWLGVPLVVTFHGSDISGTDEAAAKGSFTFRSFVRHKRQLIAQGARFVAVSRFIAERAVARGFPRDRITVHYIGVDTAVYRPSGEPKLRRQPVVVFVGRLVPAKGARDAIGAVARLPVGLRAELLVAGEGSERLALEKFARERRVPCRFLGRLSSDDARRLMQRADVVVVPSRRSQNGMEEGFGLAALEAQACGVPVVAYRTGGLGEAVEHGTTGLLVPEGAVDLLGRAIQTFLDDPALRLRMAGAARRRVCESFELRSQTAALEDIYDEVLLSATPAVQRLRQ
jgi:glycosyltransferase involved in cell wall biosynthesis